MPSVSFLPADAPAREPDAEPRRPRAVPPVPGSAAAAARRPSAIGPGRCARWARAEGLGAGEAVALLMREPSEIAALRLGLAQVGVRAEVLDAARDGEAPARQLAACRVAIVDTGLADAYAGLLGGLDAYPALWWNGADADFARLDLALAEYDDAPLCAAELLRR